MVTSKNVGLAVPDWPTTFGYNMFLFPISKWVGGILFEHTHRLMGSLVGFLTIILAVWLWLREDRRWVRSLGVIAVVGVILQGILGGLRVTMMKDQIGIFHACVAQAFLGLLVFIALVTTKFWPSLATRHFDSQKFSPIKSLAIAITVAIYVQLALGATMRHQHRDLAILDFPTANGAWIPDTSAAALAKINAWRDARALSDVSAFQIWLQMVHRFLALIIAIAIVAFCARVWREMRDFAALKRLSLLWVVLIFGQIALGAWVIWSNKAADVATAHVALGAVMLSFGVSISAICWRISQRETDRARPPSAPTTDAGMKTAIVDNPTVASSRPSFVSDLAELVKARLTLLVLLTTAVGFYLGAEPPIDYKALFQTVFGTAAAAAGAAASESMVGTPSGRAHAAHKDTTDSGGAHGAASSASARCRVVGFRRRLPGDRLQRAQCGADGNHHRDLHFCLHTAEAHQHGQHGCRRDSGRDPADDRLGGCARRHRSGGVESLRYRVFVADAALLRHRVDVPRRLFARRVPHDFKRRFQRRTQRQSECVLLHSPPGARRSARICWNCQLRLSANRACARWTIRRGRDAFSATANAERCASTVFRIDSVSSAVTGGFGSDEIMNTTSATMNRAPSRSGIAWKVTLILIPVVTLGMLLWLRNLEVSALRQRTVSSYGTVPTFQLTNQNGQPFGSGQLAGKIWIADFIYTTCPGPCPMISGRMSELQKPLEKSDVHLVSFSVDPEKDTPAVLRGYAGKLQAEPGRWDFLTGPKSAIYKLSHDGFKLAVSDGSDAQGLPVHSTRMVLVDRHGQIRGYYDATEPDAITKLVADTNHLLREQPK